MKDDQHNQDKNVTKQNLQCWERFQVEPLEELQADFQTFLGEKEGTKYSILK